MSRSRYTMVLAFLSLLVPSSATGAEQNLPRIGYVYPAGGQQGAKFQVTVGGRNLSDVTHVHISGTGAQATVTEEVKLLGLDGVNKLNAKLDELLKAKKDAETLNQIINVQKELRDYRILKKTQELTPAISSLILLEVKLAADAEPGERELRLQTSHGLSNPLVFCVGRLPECLEEEPNDALQTARRVTLPVIINGRMDRPGDWDIFRFEGHAEERIIVEVLARRLESPLDSVLELTDAAGKRLAFNDDHEDKADGLHTHHADSLIDFTLPADGAYYLYLGDAQRHGGPDYAYRLRLSVPRPDFALRVVPSSISGLPGQFVPITIFALRQDGFSGEIALTIKDAPSGKVRSGRASLGILPAIPFEIVKP
jgi:hypothetical protein